MKQGVVRSAALGAAALLSPVALGTAHGAEAPARGYEVVMPADRDYSFGGNNSGDTVAVASTDGLAIAYDSSGALPGGEAGTLQNINVAHRGKDGWATTPISPRQQPKAGGTGYPRSSGFTSDLSKALFVTADPVLTADAVSGVPELYARDTLTGAYDLLTQNVPAGGYWSVFTAFAGASDDDSHFVFETYEQLLPSAQPAGSNGVYEWDNGTLRYVAVLPDGSPASYSSVGQGAQGFNRVDHAVSPDGRRIEFSEAGGEIYVRTDGASTTLVSGSQRTNPDTISISDKTYWGASADVSKVLFTTRLALTDDATTGDDGSGTPTGSSANLYEYDLATAKLTDLSVDTNPADVASGSGVQGVVGTSDDASYVYFVALGSLVPGSTSGAPNLYLSHDGQIRYIATLDPADSQDWGSMAAGPMGITSRVSKDGRTVAFQSVGALTGFDNIDPATGTAYTEVYRYTAGNDELVCVSCRSGGARAHGSSTIGPPDFPTNVPRNLSDDGQRLFFDSADDLVPQDTNGRADVYEYTASGLQLISDGTSRYDSFFQDASATGDDVFFATRAQLAPQDQDDLVDLYDARVGGGFPPPASDQCSGSSCLTASGPGGVSTATPGSVDLQGHGNVAELRRARKAVFSVRRVGKHQRQLAARTGRLIVAVQVPRAGRIEATLRGKVRDRPVTVAHAGRSVSHSVVIHLSLHLNAQARRALAHHRRLRLRLTVTYSKASTAQRTTVSLYR